MLATKQQVKDSSALFSAVQLDATEWLSGITIVPTLYWLDHFGVLGQLGSRRERELQELLRGSSLKEGAVAGALRTLEYEGWTRLEWREGKCIVSLSGDGLEAVTLLKGARASFETAVHWLKIASEIGSQRMDPDRFIASIGNVASLVSTCWNLKGASEAVALRLRNHLDGLVICPLAVHLARSRYFQSNETELAGFKDWERAALQVLVAASLAELRGTKCRMTTRGNELLMEAGSLGVVTSYVPMYAFFDKVLLGEMQSLTSDDLHVDRGMNIWGSSESSILRHIKSRIPEEVLLDVFDRLPLSLQPAGIADIGCGDGRSAASLATFIIQNTNRGKHLVNYPLFVVGVDRSETARESALVTFGKLGACGHVSYAVIDGEVNRPADVDLEISKLNWQTQNRPLSARDFLHSMMFLLHDRTLSSLENSRQLLKTKLSTLPRWVVSTNTELAPHDAHFDCEDDLDGMFGSFGWDGEKLISGTEIAIDLIKLLEEWSSITPFGIVLVEPHARELRAKSTTGLSTSELRVLDPSAAVWGVHFASNQYLTTLGEFTRAVLLSGYLPIRRWATASQSVSVTWSLPWRDIALELTAEKSLALNWGCGNANNG